MINMTLVLLIAELVAQTPYDTLKYNCWDYATDLQAQLREQNISSRIMTGVYGSTSAHTWLKVGSEWIEATSGQLIEDRSEYDFGYYSPPKGNPRKARWKADNA